MKETLVHTSPLMEVIALKRKMKDRVVCPATITLPEPVALQVHQRDLKLLALMVAVIIPISYLMENTVIMVLGCQLWSKCL